MNMAPSTEVMAEFWPQWQGEVVNGQYPLSRLLGASPHSAVFATEATAHEVPAAAIKIVPIECVTLAQLSHWRAAADLSHPHLLRLLDAGLCQLGGRQFLFVVMEHAEQTLAQVLSGRALTGEEVRDMLPPVLDALAFLHGRNLVQGQLKPANVLVVHDQVKLASDSIRPAGEPRASLSDPQRYDPPEAQDGRLTGAGDMWALGLTLVEALTRRPPVPPDAQSAIASLPVTPVAVADAVSGCLRQDPLERPTALSLRDQFTGAARAPAAAIPQLPAGEARVAAEVLPSAPVSWRRAQVIAVCLVVALATWAAVHLSRRDSTSARVAVGSSQSLPTPTPHGPVAVPPEELPAPRPPQPPVTEATASPAPPRPPVRRSAPQAAAQPAQPPASAVSPSVIHEQIPIAAHSALETIHGHVKVAVLVIVDPSGDVADVLLENPGPSAYFARLAREAARKWTFAPADTPEPRRWLLRFEFTRGGATGRADAAP